jgi:zinc transporter ZupT
MVINRQSMSQFEGPGSKGTQFMADILYSVALGFVAGLIPVYLGLLPLPLFRRLSGSKRNLLLSFSIGILLFLFADVTGEGVELSKQVSYGSLLFAVGLIVGVVVPFLVSSRRHHVSDPSVVPDIAAKSLTAYIISFAIGLHNLGEGLALGAAYAAGQFALTTTLVVGFALHNGTEGIAISGPVSDIPVRARAPVLMGFLAGFPTIIGSVIGSLFYSDLAGALFFSTAAGALLYVVVELLRRAHPSRGTFAGLLVGILLMYFTDLLLSL